MKPRTGYGRSALLVLSMASGVALMSTDASTQVQTVAAVDVERLVGHGRASRSVTALRLPAADLVTTTTTVVPTTTTTIKPVVKPLPRKRTGPPTTAPRSPRSTVQAAPSRGGGVLPCIRRYEGAYTTNTGNGYYGAYQFDRNTWGGKPDPQGVRRSGAVTRAGHGEWANRLPSDAPPSVQDAAAAQLFRERGLKPWGNKARANCAGLTL